MSKCQYLVFDDGVFLRWLLVITIGFDDNVFLRGLEVVGFGSVQCRDVFMFKSTTQISDRKSVV